VLERKHELYFSWSNIIASLTSPEAGLSGTSFVLVHFRIIPRRKLVESSSLKSLDPTTAGQLADLSTEWHPNLSVTA